VPLLSRPPRLRRPLASGIVAAVLAAALAAAPAARGQSAEYQVKAAFLYNFAKFVEWPPSAFADSSSPFSLCILGADPFGRTLDDLVRGELVDGRPLKVDRIERLDRVERENEARRCQVLFVSSSERSRFGEVLAKVKDASVLTVGEADGFLEAGGIVRFVLADGKVRFAVNRDAADGAPIKVSSKLMRLALPAGER